MLFLVNAISNKKILFDVRTMMLGLGGDVTNLLSTSTDIERAHIEMGFFGATLATQAFPGL